MIFCGDTLFRGRYQKAGLFEFDASDFWTRPKLVNFESSIKLGDCKKITRGIALQSDKSVVDFFDDLSVQCVSLANNHFFDYQIDVDSQRAYLKERGIFSIGAGKDINEASRPFYFEKEDVIVLSFGWNVIRCAYASNGSPGVNPYEYSWIEFLVTKYREQYKTATFVTVFHWNYEFEQYPQPADREFAFHLINLGVDAVIGHHSHIIQGYEYYKGKPIFYGLGNCYFPNGVYAGFNLNFPPNANFGLSVDVGREGCKVYVTKLKNNKKLQVLEEGDPEGIKMLQQLSVFQGLDHISYIDFFKVNRKKSKLLPVYKSFRNTVRNALFDKFVLYRQFPVDIISKLRGHR